MSEQETTKKKGGKAAASKDAASVEDLERRCEEELANLTGALERAWQEAQRNGAELQRGFALEHHRLQVETQGASQQAYQEYLRALQEASSPEEAHRIAGEAANRLQQASKEAAEAARGRWQELVDDYGERFGKAQADFVESCRESFRAYVDSVKGLLAALDAGVVEPADLVVVSRALAAAAKTAGAILPRRG